MRDSADSDDYGVTRRGRKRGKFDEELVYAKRDRHRPRLTAEDAHDATDAAKKAESALADLRQREPVKKAEESARKVMHDLFSNGSGGSSTTGDAS